ncbi:hypothetical protein QIS74_09096 [Colletotrichum tabaci]|uniref:Uncharacterized protein n=1 Tax=Colletotrichum tabaci TaxID=1209068 RepID=A0AAV9T3E1_9PEZI
MMKSFANAALLLAAMSLALPQLENVKRFFNQTSIPSPPTPANSEAICTPAKYMYRQNAEKTWGWNVCDVSSKRVSDGEAGPAKRARRSFSTPPTDLPTASDGFPRVAHGS